MSEQEYAIEDEMNRNEKSIIGIESINRYEEKKWGTNAQKGNRFKNNNKTNESLKNIIET